METTNQQIISEVETNHLILNEGITKGIEEYKEYLDSLKEEEFEEKKNETEEDAIKRAEGIFDRLDEMIIRNDSSNRRALETIEILNKMTDLFNEIVIKTSNEKEKLAVKNNELLDIIINFEERKATKLIEQNPKKKNKYNGEFMDQKEELNEHRINLKEIHQKRMIKPISRPSPNNLESNEMKQIEKWTSMKIGNIIFDSDVDKWNVNSSEFDQKIVNKSNLIFLIEDEDANKFGGYINAKIVKNNSWIEDPNAFIFSLKSNGRLEGMMKFEIEDSENSFYMGNRVGDYLFYLGKFDIYVFKKSKKSLSYFKQSSFDYNGIENALGGQRKFTPKRFIVFQLI